jgi:hypothetical protein
MDDENSIRCYPLADANTQVRNFLEVHHLRVVGLTLGVSFLFRRPGHGGSEAQRI